MTQNTLLVPLMERNNSQILCCPSLLSCPLGVPIMGHKASSFSSGCSRLSSVHRWLPHSLHSLKGSGSVILFYVRAINLNKNSPKLTTVAQDLLAWGKTSESSYWLVGKLGGVKCWFRMRGKVHKVKILGRNKWKALIVLSLWRLHSIYGSEKISN